MRIKFKSSNYFLNFSQASNVLNCQRVFWVLGLFCLFFFHLLFLFHLILPIPLLLVLIVSLVINDFGGRHFLFN